MAPVLSEQQQHLFNIGIVVFVTQQTAHDLFQHTTQS
jgi:hypothetical protein